MQKLSPKSLLLSLYSRALFLLGISAAVSMMSGCSTETNAIFQSLQYAYDRSAGANSAVLNPNFRYLRAAVNGRVVFLALGYVDSDPGGPIEVWYSADREVVRLQNGRVVGVVGLTPEWRDVSLHGAPNWNEMMDDDRSVDWMRIRDVMPGYRFRVVDNLTSRRIATAQGTSLVGVESSSLHWFEDTRTWNTSSGVSLLKPANFDNDLDLPPARYGVSVAGSLAVAVYGEQCLTRSFCFSWQRWP
jgi:hypothetical protein